jgi:F-type H+-transporting ATPase subunit alpha
MLKQTQYSPLAMEDQVVSIYSCTPKQGRTSWVRDLDVSDIGRYEAEMLEYMRANHGDVLKAMRDSGKLEEDTENKLMAALDAFADIFQPSKAAGAES